MEIIPANFLDLNSLRKLERECFEKDAWPIFDLIAVLSLPDIIRLKAVEDGEMIGFVAGESRPTQGVGWIATIGVDPRYQRRGIGHSLLNECEKQLKAKNISQIRLTVRLSNHGAIALYERAGYKTVDFWKGYYVDGEDGMVMEKNA